MEICHRAYQFCARLVFTSLVLFIELSNAIACSPAPTCWFKYGPKYIKSICQGYVRDHRTVTEIREFLDEPEKVNELVEACRKLNVPLAASGSNYEVPKKILLGSHIGDATIQAITGVNSNKAVVSFRRELDDFVETCSREIGVGENGSVDSQKVAACVKATLGSEGSKPYVRRAACAWRTVYTEFGNYSLVNQEKEQESTIQGKTYRPIRTDWKDHRTEQLTGNCSGCNTPQLLSTLHVLCPNLYDELFQGLDPY